MRSKTEGFTLIELMVAILIVGVLVAASVPMMRGKIDESKWAEAKAGAGVIREAVRIYYAETGNTVTGKLHKKKVQEALDISSEDLTGTYFIPKDYRIMTVDSEGKARIQIKGSQSNAPSGTITLELDGTWN